MKPLTIQPLWVSRFSGLCCAVSTRVGGINSEPLGMNLSFNVGDAAKNVETNRRLFFGELNVPIERVAFTRQVHSDTVHAVDVAGSYETCDALVTDRSGLFLAISVADCLPILLYDPATKCIGAVHAGWRGSRKAILTSAVEMLKAQYNANPEDIVAFIGPSAGKCCYEVGEEVAAEFPAKYVDRFKKSKPHLDLKLFNKDLLLRSGVADGGIEVSDYCTICSEEMFHSYRRDGSRSGRMMGVIGMRGESQP